jgi:hypothetical protein
VLGKHLLFPTLSEHDISWQVRLRAQLSRRWVEIANDAAWVTAGLIACFVLTGPLFPMAIILAFTMQCYELALNGSRAIHEYQCMWALENKYLTMRGEADNQEDIQAINRYLVHLRNRMTNSKKLLTLNVINFTLLAIAVGMTLPWIVLFSPIIPLVGATLAVLLTIVNYIGSNRLMARNGNQLNDKLNEELKTPAVKEQPCPQGLKENSIFKPTPRVPQEQGNQALVERNLV